MSTNTDNTTRELDIDFLPARYREHTEQRKGRAWRLTSIVLLAAMLPVASFYQLRVRAGLQRELSTLSPLCEALDLRQAELADLQKKRQRLDAKAQLIAYLHHPWPRSQVLAALLPKLPDSLSLTSIQIDEMGGSTAVVMPAAKNPHQENVAQAADLLPPENDLKLLRDRHDKGQVVVLLSGMATDPADLHEYLGNLAEHRLFVKAELLSLEGPASKGTPASKAASGSQFRARLILAQCPGQPQGPQPTEPASEHATVAETGDKQAAVVSKPNAQAEHAGRLP